MVDSRGSLKKSSRKFLLIRGGIKELGMGNLADWLSYTRLAGEISSAYISH